MKKYYVIMTLNGFCDPTRVIAAPIFQTKKQAEKYLNNYKNKEYCWIDEQEDKQNDRF